MKSAVIVLLGGLLCLQGCADLIIRDDDSGGVVAGKVTGRVLVGLVTVGFSEIEISDIQKQEEKEKQETARRQAQLTQRDWFNGQIRKLTYSDAVMKWGPPHRVQELRSTIVAVWGRRQGSPGYLMIPPIPGNPYAPSLAMPLPERGSRLQLVFDRESELLQSWSIQEW